MGPDGSTELRRLPAHRGQRRPEGLGALRLREDARLPLGHLPEPGRRPSRKINFGEHKGEPAWQDVPGEHRANLRRIIVTQGDTEPASVEQQRHLGLTCAVALRPAQPVPGQRRGRPAPVGDGLPAARATSAATAARRPTRCSSAARATRTTRASSARSTRRRRTGSRSSCSRTSPTATASTSSPRSPSRASIRSRARRKFMLTEEAHHMFVGESGVARVIQRTCEVMKRAEDRRPGEGARGRRDRPADDPALPELPLQRDDRPVRRRPVVATPRRSTAPG